MRRIYDTTFFKSECMHPIGFMEPRELDRYLVQLGGTRDLYCLGQDWIGEIAGVPAEAVLEHILLGGTAYEPLLSDVWSPCLLYFGNGVAYFQGEQEIGVPERCILLDAKKRFRPCRSGD